ncbi:MAG: TrkA C-terminal domain-containing protein, partial [Bacteroidota bacterium]
MIQLFQSNPLLLLFSVAAAGYLIGSLRIFGNRLGVAAVLFVGLAVGAMDVRLDIPEIVFMLGLAMYVYSIGISSGPAFFASYKRNGMKDFGFILAMLVFSGLVAVALSVAFGFSAGQITGMYAGSTTNTPAMAGVIDYISNAQLSDKDSIIENLVIGYSFSYPMGVLGGMIAIAWSQRWLKIDFNAEKQKYSSDYPIGEDLTSRTIRITNEASTGISLRDLFNRHDWNVVFGRMARKDEGLSLASWDSTFAIGDRVMIAGASQDIDDVESVLGEKDEMKLSYDRSEYDVRQIFVSNPMVVGHSLASLELDKKYNCIISRIRRGDIEMLAKGDTVLELGDRIRFVARRQDLKEL